MQVLLHILCRKGAILFLLRVVGVVGVVAADMLEEEVDRHDGECADDGFDEHAVAAETAYRRGAPDGSSRRQTFDRIAVLEDDAGAEETDAGNDLRDDTTVVAAEDRRGHEHIERTADSDERNRTRTYHLTVQLTLQANEVTQRGSQDDFRQQQQPIGLQERIHNCVHNPSNLATKVRFFADICK